MATEIIMPAVSTSMTEGVLARWVKKEGEKVAKGEIVAEIETDKAVLELEAEGDGLLGKIFFSDGATVAVGGVMGVIVAEGEAIPDSAPAHVQESTVLPEESVLVQEKAPSAAAVESSTAENRVFASPLAKRLAQVNGIDIGTLTGSGPNGRIVKRDVESAREKKTVAPAILAPSGATASATPGNVDQEQYEEIPHSSMRRVIAQRLSESKQQVPHFYLSVDCQLDVLLDLRQKVNAALSDVKLSVNDFIVKAVAQALKKVPAANASWTETAVRQFKTVDISVAVATPAGLITPIVRNADQKSIGAISTEVKDLADRARQGKLKPHEYQGGGFSISNLGMYGVQSFAAIINPPQACILAVGAGEKRAVVRGEEIVAATVMTTTLSVDHRVVDGAVGAEFLAQFKHLIENPLNLLV